MSISLNQQKKDALKELIWYICQNYSHQLFETKLWKLVFFCDTDYYQKYSSLLTAVPYIKNKRGPTPSYSLAKKAIDELVKDGYIVKTENSTYVALKEYPLKQLDNQKVDAISNTCEKYYKLSSNEICTLAHRDPVYLATENLNELLDFSFVAYRDDGAPDGEEDEDIPSTITFSQKAKENLLKTVFA